MNWNEFRVVMQLAASIPLLISEFAQRGSSAGLGREWFAGDGKISCMTSSSSLALQSGE